MIDEYSPRIFFKNKVVFAYKNIKTGHSGLMLVE